MPEYDMVIYDALYASCADTPLKKIERLLGLGSDCKEATKTVTGGLTWHF